jgi:hypothetical protein
MTRLITFADDSMTIAAKICEISALQNNVHEVKVYGPKDIDSKFRKANAAILDQPRGVGYWLWKPYFIDRELKKMKDGDILIYADAGVEIVNNVNHIIDRMQDDVWLFGNMWQHLHFCKADAFIPILSNQYYNYQGKQAQASVIIICNSESARQFVKQWLEGCCVPGWIDDSPSKLPNLPEFQEHRHDQAILTCWAIRNDIPLHWWPAMYNAGAFTYEKTGYNDDYPVLFHHHRMRNNQFTSSDSLDQQITKYFNLKYSL